ncbi:MAG: hypothetical protein Q7R85_02545 [bacterium]|nr:hypothetical protein [bacterium]
MNTSSQFSDKAQEIGYALIRVAAYVRRKDFRSRLEELALALVDNVVAPEPDGILDIIAAAQNVIKLGASVYEIETVNARILLRELEGLASEIRQSFGIDKLPDLSTMFSTASPAISLQSDIAASHNVPVENNERVAAYDVDSAMPISDGFKETSVDIADEVIPPILQSTDKQQPGMVSVGSAIRQSAILEKIKLSSGGSSGNGIIKGCRMKDLIAEFPDVSERTLRYDLQRLLQHGAIDRLGNGGPASYYVMK